MTMVGREEEVALELAPQQVIAERFRLDRELGQGGMGAVWAATHVITNKKVALKFMHSNSAEMSARFVREAQAASAVRHPNVVDIHDIIPLPDGTPLMVMEMLEGEALAERLSREGRLAPEATAQIMLPVISAISAAHAAGIVHRDLKPENIFLARVGGTIVPKVLDFGIAKVAPQNVPGKDSNLTRTGSVLGTPYYMSPEQVFGEKDVDARSDIWALGVIIYQCLTGRRPFDGENFGQLFKSVALGVFEPLEKAAPWVPQPMLALVTAMLRERQTRLSDLGEVERTLLLCCSPGSGSLPIPGSIPNLPRVQSSGGFNAMGMQQSSGGWPVAAAQQSGAHPGTAVIAGAGASGGYPMVGSPPGVQSSGGFAAANSAAMTPAPMTRSGTMRLAQEREGSVPMKSSGAAKIIVAVVGAAVLGVIAVVAAIHLRSTRSIATSQPQGITVGDTGTSSAAPLVVSATTTSSAPAALSASAVVATSASASQSSHPVASATAVAAANARASATAAAASTHSNNSKQHAGGTGGLATEIP